MAYNCKSYLLTYLKSCLFPSSRSIFRKFKHNFRLCYLNKPRMCSTPFFHFYGTVYQNCFTKPLNSCQNIYGNFRLRNMSSTTSGDGNRNVNYEQLVDLMDEGSITLIDVREKDELKETGEIPGSYNIPLGDIPYALKEMNDDIFEDKYNFKKPSVNDTLVFSCRSGKRSLMALEEALKAGYKKSLNFSGGWLEWEEKAGVPKKSE